MTVVVITTSAETLKHTCGGGGSRERQGREGEREKT